MNQAALSRDFEHEYIDVPTNDEDLNDKWHIFALIVIRFFGCGVASISRVLLLYQLNHVVKFLPMVADHDETKRIMEQRHKHNTTDNEGAVDTIKASFLEGADATTTLTYDRRLPVMLEIQCNNLLKFISEKPTTAQSANGWQVSLSVTSDGKFVSRI